MRGSFRLTPCLIAACLIFSSMPGCKGKKKEAPTQTPPPSPETPSQPAQVGASQPDRMPDPDVATLTGQYRAVLTGWLDETEQTQLAETPQYLPDIAFPAGDLMRDYADNAVRVLFPIALEAAGFPEQARILRSSQQLRSQRDLMAAQESLWTIAAPVLLASKGTCKLVYPASKEKAHCENLFVQAEQAGMALKAASNPYSKDEVGKHLIDLGRVANKMLDMKKGAAPSEMAAAGKLAAVVNLVVIEHEIAAALHLASFVDDAKDASKRAEVIKAFAVNVATMCALTAELGAPRARVVDAALRVFRAEERDKAFMASYRKELASWLSPQERKLLDAIPQTAPGQSTGSILGIVDDTVRAWLPIGLDSSGLGDAATHVRSLPQIEDVGALSGVQHALRTTQIPGLLASQGICQAVYALPENEQACSDVLEKAQLELILLDALSSSGEQDEYDRRFKDFGDTVTLFVQLADKAAARDTSSRAKINRAADLIQALFLLLTLSDMADTVLEMPAVDEKAIGGIAETTSGIAHLLTRAGAPRDKIVDGALGILTRRGR